MSIESHIDHLIKKHFTLDKKIHDARLHHLPIGALKKERLFVKDQIEQCRKHG
jgi:hypothetical protein